MQRNFFRFIILLTAFIFCGCSHFCHCKSVKVVDVSGNTYDGVCIGKQIWMKQNLTTSQYKNGDIIPQVTDPVAWGKLTTGAWCYYNNDPATGATYGKLYNWYAVNDSRGLAPIGWHIPDDFEWTKLTSFLGGENVAGGKMKETGVLHWAAPNVDATNSSYFTAIASGFRHPNSTFVTLGTLGNWWSSTSIGPFLTVWFRQLSHDNGKIFRINYDMCYGFSVRCIKN